MRKDRKDLARRLKEMEAQQDFDLDLLIEGAKALLEDLPPDLKKAVLGINLTIKQTALAQDLDYDSKKFKQIWMLSLAILDSFLEEMESQKEITPDFRSHATNVMFAVGMV